MEIFKPKKITVTEEQAKANQILIDRNQKLLSFSDKNINKLFGK